MQGESGGVPVVGAALDATLVRRNSLLTPIEINKQANEQNASVKIVPVGDGKSPRTLEGPTPLAGPRASYIVRPSNSGQSKGGFPLMRSKSASRGEVGKIKCVLSSRSARLSADVGQAVKNRWEKVRKAKTQMGVVNQWTKGASNTDQLQQHVEKGARLASISIRILSICDIEVQQGTCRIKFLCMSIWDDDSVSKKHHAGEKIDWENEWSPDIRISNCKEAVGDLLGGKETPKVINAAFQFPGEGPRWRVLLVKNMDAILFQNYKLNMFPFDAQRIGE
jgi:hypothetical protein